MRCCWGEAVNVTGGLRFYLLDLNEVDVPGGGEAQIRVASPIFLSAAGE